MQELDLGKAVNTSNASSPGRATLTNTPYDVLAILFSLLTLESSVCLALTSTKLWAAFKANTLHGSDYWRIYPDGRSSPIHHDPGALGFLLRRWMGPSYRLFAIRGAPFVFLNTEVYGTHGQPDSAARLRLRARVEDYQFAIGNRAVHFGWGHWARRRDFWDYGNLPNPWNMGDGWYDVAREMIMADLAKWGFSEDVVDYWGRTNLWRENAAFFEALTSI